MRGQTTLASKPDVQSTPSTPATHVVLSLRRSDVVDAEGASSGHRMACPVHCHAQRSSQQRASHLTPTTAMPPHASAYGGRFDTSYARLPQRLYARPHADARPVPPPGAVERGPGGGARTGGHVAGECRGDRGLGRESRPRGPTRWRWPMPGISLATSCRSSAMGGRSCWAKSWAGMARGAICS